MWDCIELWTTTISPGYYRIDHERVRKKRIKKMGGTGTIDSISPLRGREASKDKSTPVPWIPQSIHRPVHQRRMSRVQNRLYELWNLSFTSLNMLRAVTLASYERVPSVWVGRLTAEMTYKDRVSDPFYSSKIEGYSEAAMCTIDLPDRLNKLSEIYVYYST